MKEVLLPMRQYWSPKYGKPTPRIKLTRRIICCVKHFNGPSRVVYLGDVSKTLLAQLSQLEKQVFHEGPGYNEQRWKMKTTSSGLTIDIHSTTYWGWGLLTSGYLNIISLRGH